MSNNHFSGKELEALKMLRQRRKERAEQEVAKASRQLQEVSSRFSQAQQQQAAVDAEHQRQRASLSADYQENAMSTGELRHWQRQERALIDGVNRYRHALETLRNERDDQQERLDSHRQQLKKRQLGLEKLYEMQRLLRQGG